MRLETGMARGWGLLLALCAAATICVDWAFIFPNGTAAASCARLRHGPSRIEPRTSQEGLAQEQSFLGTWQVRCFQACCGLLLGLALSSPEVLAKEDVAAVTAKKRGAESSVEALKVPEARDDEITRRALKQLTAIQSNPEAFWEGEAPGPEPEGASYGVSRGMMKNMRAAMKKRPEMFNQ